jgi:FkbM family methyltransferase
VDVGANIGYFSTLAAGIVKEEGSVVSIEAMPRTCEVLTKNFRLNGIRNGRIVGVAAWDTEGKIDIFGPCEGISGTTSAVKSLAEKWEHKSRTVVPCAPLPSLLTPTEVKGARIVKIDVEGAEWRVVSGMSELLERGRYDLEIVVEVNPDGLRVEGRSCRDLYAFFKKFGFYAYKIDNLYGDLSHISLSPPSRPRRIERISEEVQSDIVFSRRDLDAL